ncbi:MAG: hypothetical protein JXA95_19285 [Spirochaetales bacterium]|nr:hypothetical protein [Spirochaetales bacterium]
MKIKSHIFSSALCFFLIFPLFFLLSQEKSGDIVGGEAPSTIWTYKMGDSNVDFYWDGYWRFHFSAGLALGAEKSFSDYTSPYRFSQTPDLLISLWIDDRYYFEASVVEDYNKNSYLLGYQGGEGEYLQSAKLGNSSVTTDSYAGLAVSSPLYNTPGFSLKGNTDRMQNEFMIRFDGTWEESRLYIGSYEANEEYLELYDYRRNRRFLLPDQTVDGGSLTVFIGDSNGAYQAAGTSQKYRLAEEGDYLFDSADGILTLEEEPDGPVAVYYTVGGTAVGDGTLGGGSVIPPGSTDSGIPDVTQPAEDFFWTKADPYDTQGRTYAASRQETINGKAGLLLYEPDRFSPFAFYDSYDFTQSLSTDSWRNDLSLSERYGTESNDLTGLSWSSDPSEKNLTITRSGTGARDALARYPLGDLIPEIYGNAPANRPELVPWQIRLVTKTGSSGYRLGTGVVPGSLTVTVNGRPESNYTLDSDRGTVTFGRYIFPSDRVEFNYRRETLNFEGQEMLIYQGNRFSLTPRDTLETAESFNWVFPDGTDNSTPDGGTIKLGASWEHKGESFQLRTELTGTADLGDADGVERILGMENALSAFPVYEEALAEPKAGDGETDNDYPAGDYIIMNSSSGPLVDETPAGASFDTPALKADFSLTASGSGEWTGADLHLTNSGALDFSTLQELRFYIYIDGTTTAGDLILKLGETGEDRDFDSDGVIADYDEALVATEVIANTSLPSGAWKQIIWTLTTDDRQKLSRTRSLRFLFPYNSGWTDTDSPILIGGLELVGQTFSLDVSDDTTTLSFSEKSDGTLRTAYPDEIDQFHTDGSAQRVSEFSWSGFDNTDTWTAVNWQESRDMARFGKIRFFVKHDGSTGDYTLDLTDLNEEGVHLKWQSAAAGWQMVTIDLTDEKASFDGGANNVDLTIDGDAGTLNRIALTGKGIDAAAGSVSLDEIYFEESVITLSGKSAVSLNYKKEDLLTGVSGIAWLGDYYLDLDTTGSLSGRTKGLRGETGSVAFDGQTGLEILYLDLNLLGNGTWEGNTMALWGGHEMTFPSVSSPVVIEESFALGDDSSAPLLTHGAGVTLTPEETIQIKGNHETSLKQEKLTQEWNGSVTYSGDKEKISLNSDWATLSGEEEQQGTGYFTVWGDSWSYFIPHETDVTSRSVKESLSLKFDGDLLTPRMTIDRSTNYSYGLGGEQTNALSSTLSLPIALTSLQGLTITPSYNRTLSLTGDRDSSGGFTSDYQYWADRVLPLLPLTHFIPLWELGDDSPVMAALPLTGTYSYAPRFSLEISRNYGSLITDLFIPSFGEASFGRAYKGETDSRYYADTWDFTLQQRALNLFGSFGVKPLIPLYATEEIANTLTMTFYGKNTSLPPAESFSWNSYGRFEGEKGNSLELENDLTITIGEEELQNQLSASYNWRGDRKPYRKIPFSRYIVSHESYVTNRIGLSYGGASSPEAQSHEGELSHTAQLFIDDLGSLKSWIKLGTLWEEGTGLTFGTEVGVELTLTF